MVSPLLNALAVLLLSGFFTLSVFAQQQTNLSELLRSVGSVTNVEVKVHVLAPGDILELKVYQEEDLNLVRAVVARDGTITHPLLGVVPIGGKTLEQARATFYQLLAKDYLVNPKVSLTILEFSKWRFTVLGHVARPGSYEVSGNQSIDLLEAIALAGGFSRLGSPSKVTVQRIVGGEKRTFKNLDAEAMAKDRNTKPFPILPDDKIEVGEKVF